jgi:hypothetical protein
MNLASHDPLLVVLAKYSSDVVLGPKQPSFERDDFIRDLDQVQRRNGARFYVVLAILVAFFTAAITISAVNAQNIKPQWLFGAGGLFGGGFGALLLQLNRSWWRTDTLLTVAKYSSPQTLSLIVRAMLAAESERYSFFSGRRRKAKSDQ